MTKICDCYGDCTDNSDEGHNFCSYTTCHDLIGVLRSQNYKQNFQAYALDAEIQELFERAVYGNKHNFSVNTYFNAKLKAQNLSRTKIILSQEELVVFCVE